MGETTGQSGRVISLDSEFGFWKSFCIYWALNHKHRDTVAGEVHRAIKKMHSLNTRLADLPTCGYGGYNLILQRYYGWKECVQRELPLTEGDERKYLTARFYREVDLEHDAAHHFKTSPN